MAKNSDAELLAPSNYDGLQNLLQHLSDSKKNEISKIYSARKKSKKIIGFGYRPFVTRPKKAGFGKLTAFYDVMGTKYEELICQDVEQNEVFDKLIGLKDKQAEKAYQERSKLKHFGLLKYPKLKKYAGNRI